MKMARVRMSKIRLRIFILQLITSAVKFSLCVMRFEEKFDNKGLLYAVLPYIFAKDFPRLEPDFPIT